MSILDHILRYRLKRLILVRIKVFGEHINHEKFRNFQLVFKRKKTLINSDNVVKSYEHTYSV